MTREKVSAIAASKTTRHIIAVVLVTPTATEFFVTILRCFVPPNRTVSAPRRNWQRCAERQQLHVASMSRGVSGNVWESLKLSGNKRELSQHGATRKKRVFSAKLLI